MIFLITELLFETTCHYSLRNNPEEHISHLLRERSLKSRKVHLYGEATLRYVQRFVTYFWLSRNVSKKLPLLAA
jgi:hypothetical protein